MAAFQNGKRFRHRDGEHQMHRSHNTNNDMYVHENKKQVLLREYSSLSIMALPWHWPGRIRNGRWSPTQISQYAKLGKLLTVKILVKVPRTIDEYYHTALVHMRVVFVYSIVWLQESCTAMSTTWMSVTGIATRSVVIVTGIATRSVVIHNRRIGVSRLPLSVCCRMWRYAA